MPQTIGVIVGAKLASLHDMDTIYGLEDMYDLLEIAQVDAYNDFLANKPPAEG